MKNMNRNYVRIVGLFAVAALLNHFAPNILGHITSLPGAESPIAETLWCMGLFLMFGWACSKFSEGTIFQNFTLQLIVGIILHDVLGPINSNVMLAVVVCTALAAIILKGGGDEVERRLFKKIAFPTIMIAVVGYLVTFFIMFSILLMLGIDPKIAALLAAIIGSTDPASLIPTLKDLTFKPEYKRITDIAVAESALNDAVGAIFTASVAAMILAGTSVESVGALASGLFKSENMLHLGEQFLFGVIAGIIGWVIMYRYEAQKSADHQKDIKESSYDFAIILAVPLITFLLAQLIHGNGFLAAFVAGLLANYNHGKEYFHKTLHTMEIKIESIAKPIIFMMVGPFVSLADLWEYALPGLLISLAFMLIVRPLAVEISWLFTKMTRKEKCFMWSVREAGVIPVVLAVITVSVFPQFTSLLPLTAWVVIWTLTVLPAITPWWAKTLKIVEA